MKRLSVNFLLLCFSILLVQSMTFANGVKVAKEQKVLASACENINSEAINSGYAIKAFIASDITINSVKIFAKNTPMVLIATEVVPRKKIGAGGKIIIKQALINDVNGNEHVFNVQKTIKGSDKDWIVLCMGLGTTIILCPFLLFGFVKGNTAEIPVGMIIECKLEDEFTLYQKL